jgi:hypothetical protein
MVACGDRLRLSFFGNDRAAQRHTLIANAYCPWSGDQALNFLLTATTE